jgi:hypothetical protein
LSNVRRLLVADWEDPSERPPAWIADVAEQVNKILMSSRENPGVSIESVVSALQMLGRVMSVDTVAPQVVPRFNGGLQLEWHTHGVDLELSIDPDGRRSAWCEHSSGREWEDEQGEVRVSRLRKELSILTRNDV